MGMFWRFGLNSSAIDGLLDKEDLTLEELMDEDDLIQECKAHNNKLIEYLRDPVILSQLLNYIIRDDLDDRQKFKYPYLACEVLSCEIWAIFESLIDNPELLNNFWTFLDRPPPLNPLQASYFTKVNLVFLQKKTSEMVKITQSYPNVVKKLLMHMETPTVMDLLLRLISIEEYPEGTGIVDWLNSQGLIQVLVAKLDPNLEPDTHSTAAQVLMDIITVSQSSNPEQGCVGPNALSRELISEKTVTQLVDYMLDNNAPNSTSTLINGVSIFIQIIQKNNCDFNQDASLGPNHRQQHPVLDLSDMLRVLANRIGDFKKLLEKPKSVSGEIDTTIGKMVPLGFERFRICELFAELLHCSNMSLLNSISHDQSTNGFFELKNVEEYNDYGQPEAAFVPVVNNQTPIASNGLHNNHETTRNDTIDDIPEESNENIKEPNSEKLKDSFGLKPMEVVEPAQASQTSVDSINNLDPSTQLPGPTQSQIPVGDMLKEKFIEEKIIPTCLDLFFDFKWNNFLHTVVYDMIAQIFNGRMDIGYNKSLAISVFTDGQLTRRITAAQKLNEEAIKQQKGVRLGYMGHLTFIAEEVVKLLDRYAVEIGEKVREYTENKEWQEYISETLRETRERDRAPLGGQRPHPNDSMSPSHAESEEEEEEDPPIDMVAADNQFARYWYQHQQFTNNLPDKSSSSDEDEDEDESYGDAAYINHHMLEEENFEKRTSSLGDDFAADSDDEEHSTQWTPNPPDNKLLTSADYSAEFQSSYSNDSNTIQESKNHSGSSTITSTTLTIEQTSVEHSEPNSHNTTLPSQSAHSSHFDESPFISPVSGGDQVASIDTHKKEEPKATDEKKISANADPPISMETEVPISLGGDPEKNMNFPTYDKSGVKVEGSKEELENESSKA